MWRGAGSQTGRPPRRGATKRVLFYFGKNSCPPFPTPPPSPLHLVPVRDVRRPLPPDHRVHLLPHASRQPRVVQAVQDNVDHGGGGGLRAGHEEVEHHVAEVVAALGTVERRACESEFALYVSILLSNPPTAVCPQPLLVVVVTCTFHRPDQHWREIDKVTVGLLILPPPVVK